MKKLKTKFIFTVCVICFVCLGLITGICYTISASIITRKSDENLELMCDKYSKELDGWFGKQGEQVIDISSTIQNLEIYDEEQLYDYLEKEFELLNTEDYLYDLYYTTSKNVMICASGYVPDGTVDYVHDREWYVEAEKSGELYYSTPYKDSDSGRIVITISKSVIKDGKVDGVFSADIFVDTIVEIINQAEVPNNSYAFLVDSKIEMVTHPNEAYGFVDDEAVPLENLEGNIYSEVINKISNNEEGSIIVSDYDGVKRSIQIGYIDSAKWYVGMATSVAETTKDLNSLVVGLAIAIVVSLLIGIIIILIVVGKLLKPILGLKTAVEKGDISQDIIVKSSDEIGELSNGFNTMMGRLREMIVGVADVVENINEASNMVNGMANDIHQDTAVTSDNIDKVAGAMNDQLEKVTEGMDNLKNFEESTNEFEKCFAELEQIVKTMIEDINNNMGAVKDLESSTVLSNSNMKELKLKVQELERQSEQINDIVSAITDISGQTNLLALNASIEAARAGEAGKGFAVVADEIRVLSNQTNDAIANILNITNAIKGEIKNISGYITNVSKAFDDNLKNANSVKDVFFTLEKNTDAVGEQNKNLIDALQILFDGEAAIRTTFGQINDNADNCANMAAETTTLMDKQTKSTASLVEEANSLRGFADTLYGHTEKFKIN